MRRWSGVPSVHPSTCHTLGPQTAAYFVAARVRPVFVPVAPEASLAPDAPSAPWVADLSPTSSRLATLGHRTRVLTWALGLASTLVTLLLAHDLLSWVAYHAPQLGLGHGAVAATVVVGLLAWAYSRGTGVERTAERLLLPYLAFLAALGLLPVSWARYLAMGQASAAPATPLSTPPHLGLYLGDSPAIDPTTVRLAWHSFSLARTFALCTWGAAGAAPLLHPLPPTHRGVVGSLNPTLAYLS